MTYINAYNKLDDLGLGHFRLAAYVTPVAYDVGGGAFQTINTTFVDSGDANLPHLVSTAPFQVAVAPDGRRRIYPIRSDLTRYVEFEAPYIKPVATWQQISLGAAIRAANLLTWTTANANIYVQHAGHYIKLGILLKGGWLPPGGEVAFPISLVGLTRQGNQILANGVPVLILQAPVAYDLAAPGDVRPINFAFGAIGGKTGVLFSGLAAAVAGMAQPFIDPTLTLQPAAAAGKDNSLRESSKTQNLGTDSAFATEPLTGDGWTTVIQFDVSSIVAGSTVDSATMSLWPGNANTGRVSTAYPILAANASWTEGGSNYNTYDGTTNWAGGQLGCSVSGTDHSASSVGSWSSNGTDVEVSSAITASAVQAWVDGANYGLVLKNGSANVASWRSSDFSTAGSRPKLVVNYTLAGGTASSTVMAMTGVGM